MGGVNLKILVACIGFKSWWLLIRDKKITKQTGRAWAYKALM